MARPVGQLTLGGLARSPAVWGLAIACSASSAASASLSVWQPQLIKGFGLTNVQTGLVNAIPYGFAAALMMVWGLHSDRTGERRWHTAAPLLVIAVGVSCVSLSTGSLAAPVALLSSTLVGYSSFKGPFWAFTASTLSPGTAAAGIAGINAVSNLAGGAMVSLVGLIQAVTGSYALALLPIAALAVTGAVIVLLMDRRGGTTLAADRALPAS